MPGGDRTGPGGLGPMTGRAAGFCAGYSAPGYANPVGGRLGMGFRRGRGYGRGPGWGYRRGFYAGHPAYYPAQPTYGVPYANYQPQPMDAKQEMNLLESEAADIKAELDAVNKRLNELRKTNKE